VPAIQDAKSFLVGAKPRDVLVLAIAGHGLHDRDPASTYYYLSYETRLEDLAGSAAPFDLVEDILDGVPPRTKLFLMDTCESGEVDEDAAASAARLDAESGSKARAVSSSRGLAVVGKAQPEPRPWLAERNRYIFNPLNRRTGAIVFSSSRGGEFSYESDEIENGFFTYQILRGLQGGIKSDQGLVSFDALKAYVSGEVSAMSRGLQNPTVDRNNYFLKFSLPQAMLAPRHLGTVFDVRWESRTIVSAGAEGNLLVRDAAAEGEARALYGRADRMRSLALSPDGLSIAAGYEDGRLLIYDARDGSERARLPGHEVRVDFAAFSPDGKRLVSLDSIGGGELRIWDLEAGTLERELGGELANSPDYLHAAFSPDGASLLVSTRSASVKAYRLADGKLARSYAGPSGNAVAAAYVPGDREIAALWDDGKVYIWDARIGRRSRSIAFTEEGLSIETMRISPDGRFLAGLGDGILGLWELQTGKLLWRTGGADPYIADAAFSPD